LDKILNENKYKKENSTFEDLNKFYIKLKNLKLSELNEFRVRREKINVEAIDVGAVISLVDSFFISTQNLNQNSQQNNIQNNIQNNHQNTTESQIVFNPKTIQVSPTIKNIEKTNN